MAEGIDGAWFGVAVWDLRYEKNVVGRHLPTAALKHQPGSSSQCSFLYARVRLKDMSAFQEVNQLTYTKSSNPQ
jgi:hypothetical protein